VAMSGGWVAKQEDGCLSRGMCGYVRGMGG
jgi:hypothetical protein